MSDKLNAGDPMPEMTLPTVGGGNVTIGGEGRWQMVVVYRGKHCPKCQTYLGKLETLTDAFAAINTEIVAVSGDPQEKAEANAAEQGWTFPVAYGLSVAQMRRLGLYVSNPRSPRETDRQFPEPGLFVVNPKGQAQIIDISNAPFARPDLDGVAGGLKFIQDNDYPIRGTG